MGLRRVEIIIKLDGGLVHKLGVDTNIPEEVTFMLARDMYESFDKVHEFCERLYHEQTECPVEKEYKGLTLVKSEDD